mgnify:FL=1
MLPKPADTIIKEFVQQISKIEQFLIEGIYLTGSIGLSDFHSNKSDIDFLIFCRDLPDDKIALKLKFIHQKIAKQYPKPDLSGSYLTLESIKSDNTATAKILSWHQNVMRYREFEMSVISLSELKLNALTIFGQQAEDLPIEIDQDELNKFLYHNINSYWRKWINQHSTFFNRKLLLLFFPRFTEWSVLGAGRQLCTLQTGKIVSKTEAGYYCLKHLPSQFHPVIQEAIQIRKDNRTYPLVRSYLIKPSFDRLEQTIQCVNYIIDTFNATYKLHQPQIT